MTRVALSLLVLCIANACHRTERDRSLTSTDPDARSLQTALAQATPVGSSLDSARVFMQSNGFTCEHRINETFAGLQDGRRADFLWCSKSKASGVVEHRWQTIHIDTAGRLKAVFAFEGLRAP